MPTSERTPVVPEAAVSRLDSPVASAAETQDEGGLRDAKLKELFRLMDELGAEAERNGLTPEILEQELAAWKRERSA